MLVTVSEEDVCSTVAADWERVLRIYRDTCPEGEVIVLAGVGADGHIAGILCHTADETPVFTGTEWIVSHHFQQTDNLYPHRITPTFTGWKEVVDRSYIYMSGEEKYSALTDILADAGDLHTTPARILRELEQCHLYTDAPKQ